jgi:ATP-dependent helicase HrpA
VARLASTILVEYAAAARKIKDTKIQPDATGRRAAAAAAGAKRFLPTPWTRLQHFCRAT